MTSAREDAGRTMNRRILISYHWPEVLGQGPRVQHYNGYRRAVSEDGRYWEVRRSGLFRRWEWLPKRGMYVRLSVIGGRK